MKHALFQKVLAFSLVSALVFSNTVFADTSDTTPPVISSATVTNDTVAISAKDNIKVTEYGYSRVQNAGTVSNWQSTSRVSGVELYVTYYAYTKDAAGNISLPYAFKAKDPDKEAPVINKVDTTAKDTITITAKDNVRVTYYGLSKVNDKNAVLNWNPEAVFNNLEQNVTYYAFAKDEAENVSIAHSFKLPDKDTIPPYISTVVKNNNYNPPAIQIRAFDNVGTEEFGVSETNDPAKVKVWQTSATIKNFDLTKQYYAFVKDAAGNISEGYRFQLDDADVSAPIVKTVTFTDTETTVTASDNVYPTAYAISETEAIEGLNWQVSTSFGILDEDKTYFAYAKDAAGNISLPFVFRSPDSDKTPPIITRAEVNAPSRKVRIRAVDNNAVEYYGTSEQNDVSTVTNWQTSGYFENLQENKIYYAFARDKAGLVSPPCEFKLVLDKEPPLVERVFVFSDETSASVTVSDNESGAYAAISETNDPSKIPEWGGTQPFKNLIPNKTYYAFAKDREGNISEPYPFQAVDSTSKPYIYDVVRHFNSTSIQIGANNASKFGFSLADNPAGVTNWQAEKSFDNLQRDTLYYAFAKDEAGNISDAYRFKLNIDNEPPVITKVDVPVNGTTATITATDQSNITQYGIAVTSNPDDVIEWTPSKTFDNLKEDTVYYVFAEDVYGNVSGGYGFMLDIDRIRPTIGSVSYSSSNKYISVNAVDNVKVTAYSLATSNDPSKIENWSPNNKFLDADPDTLYYIFVKDARGNISNPYMFKANMKTELPIINGVRCEVNATIALISPKGILDNFVYGKSLVNDKSTVTSWQSSNILSELEENKLYYAFIKDKQNNISNGYGFMLNPDITPPVINSIGTNNTTKKVVVSATDDVGIVSYGRSKINDPAAVEDWQTPYNFNFQEDYTIYYYFAKDAHGNISNTYAFKQEDPDKEPPVVNFVSCKNGTAEIQAKDNKKVTAYGISIINNPDAVIWQSTNTVYSIQENITYYAFVKDAAGNVSSSYWFGLPGGDFTAPIITRVDTELSTATIIATDDTGVVNYGVADTNDVSKAVWQDSNLFTDLKQGTHYAFAKDSLDHISDGFEFIIDIPDNEPPVVTGVTYDGTKVTITATDNVEVYKYGISETQNPADVIAWKQTNTFTSITADKEYYAFAKDIKENISAPYYFKTEAPDTIAPQIQNVEVNAANVVTIHATDNKAVVKYGTSKSKTASTVTNWQDSNTFTDLDANSIYYAFAKDEAGNISDAKIFETNMIDNPPVVTSVEFKGINVYINAADDIGIAPEKGYGVSKSTELTTITWKNGNSFSSPKAGETWYAFAKDTSGQISEPYCFVMGQDSGTAVPVITNVAVDDNNTAVITAQNATHYAISETNTTDNTTDWKINHVFEGLKQNTTYYAFVKNGDLISNGYRFTTKEVQADDPKVISVTISGGKVTINGTGTLGIAKHGVSTTESPANVIAWKTSNSFVSLTQGVTYYAFVKDTADNISAPYRFTMNSKATLEEIPATDEPTTDEPATDEPATDEPTTDEPTTDEPATDEPTTDEPTTDEPTTDEPATDEPATDEPTINEPTTDEPATDKPATDEPTTDEPTINEPATDEPTTDEPATDKPATDKPATDEPTTDEPTINEPATDEPTTDEPTTDEPTTDEPTTNEPTNESELSNETAD